MPFRGGGVHPIEFGQKKTFNTNKNGDPKAAEFGQKKTFNTNKNGDPKAAAGDAVVVI